MSGVVLRCPNCGTNQDKLGECEACHEPSVRYFCTNHDPGRWLDGPACPQCRARYGESGPTPLPRPPAQEPTATRRRTPPPEPTPSPSRSARPGSTPVSERAPPRRAERGPWEHRAPPPIPGRETDRGKSSRRDLPRWPDLLRDAARMRRRPPADYGIDEAPVRAPFAGCRRAALLMIVLFMMLFALALFSGGPLLQILLQLLLTQ